MSSIIVPLLAGGYQRSASVAAVLRTGLPELIASLSPGPFGRSSKGTALLEALVDAVDACLAARATLEGVLTAEMNEHASLLPPALDKAHRDLVAAFQLAVLCEEAGSALTALCPKPDVDGAFELDGVEPLLAEPDPMEVARRGLRLVAAYVERQRSRIESEPERGAALATTVSAALELMHRTIVEFSRLGRLRALVEALSKRKVSIGPHSYVGLSRRGVEEPSGLLPVRPDEIVGNEAFLEAGLRLSRDVAGFDLEAGLNPKRINPVLFGLGAPGCGKTITAHAIGNVFLDYCRERGIPAKFVVVRRSDWASSYQNASAANLIRIFREEVFGFPGVAGAYWPDIDTALASRDTPGLRSEEKQNLGAVFSIFDGTLLPNSGKWFMICDANTMHMDEAAVSRIAQNPYKVEGPTKPEHYSRMMRQIMLADVARSLPSDDDAWHRIGELAAGHRLSGRSVGHIAGNVRAHIQDFEYPDEYFRSSTDERRAMLQRLCRSVDEAFLVQCIENHAAFQREAMRQEEEARFEREVESVVRQLNAGRAAVDRLGLDPGVGTSR